MIAKMAFNILIAGLQEFCTLDSNPPLVTIGEVALLMY
jgi:hypothetical protein